MVGPYSQSRPAARTPAAASFGARLLLAFVFATIPAGIAAKTRFGDILANVDVLHGTSESLLTFSNFLFAFGFAAAVSRGAGGVNTLTGSTNAAVLSVAPEERRSGGDDGSDEGASPGERRGNRPAGGDDSAGDEPGIVSPVLALATLVARALFESKHLVGSHPKP